MRPVDLVRAGDSWASCTAWGGDHGGGQIESGRPSCGRLQGPRQREEVRAVLARSRCGIVGAMAEPL